MTELYDLDPVTAERVYRADARANYSKIKSLSVSALAYKNGLNMCSQDTLDVGNGVHMAVLEPDHFTELVVAYTGKVRRGAEYEAFKVENKDKLILKRSDYDKCTEIAARVHAHPVAAELLAREGVPERPVFWVDKRTGIACKAKPDLLLTGGIVVELKTSRSSHPDDFPRQVASLSYHAQAAFYCDAVGAEEHYFIVADSDLPGDVVVYKTPPDVLDEGRELYRGWLDQLKEIQASGEHPGAAENSAIDLQLPAWAYSLDHDGDNETFTLEEKK